MDKCGSNRDEQRKNRRFSQEQYDMLLRCSEKKDMTEWNEWRAENPNEEVLLECAQLNQHHLKRANLIYAHLEGAMLLGAHLEGAILVGAHLKDAKLNSAYLGDNILIKAHLEGADLRGTHLEGAYLIEAHLEGASFEQAFVDGSTTLLKCKVNPYCKNGRYTDFSAVGLSSVRIDPQTKQLLEYNIRRKNWEEWYKVGPWWEKIPERLLVQPFWWMSNYGRSVGRIVACFFGLAVVFALVYWLWPSCVMVNGVVGDIRGLWHALYFSVVTMTTLGFGDIAANPDSAGGQALLMLQVILGYVLLGALVTRFAVLFTAGGPAGKFADEKGEKDETEQRAK